MSEMQCFLETPIFPKCQCWLKADQHGWELVLFHVPSPLGVVVLNKDDLSLVQVKLQAAQEKFRAILKNGNFITTEFPGSKIDIAVMYLQNGKHSVTLSIFNSVFATAITEDVNAKLFDDLERIACEGDKLLEVALCKHDSSLCKPTRGTIFIPDFPYDPRFP